MARSKIGGAWGFLRGSIGSVTYSTRKTSSGKREQIARQKAEQVNNPNTVAQILQRMKLGPAQRFYDAFENVVAKGILSHAFEAVPYGSASRQYFLSKAMKEESAVFVPKGVDFFVPGEYLVSEGSIASMPYFNQLTAEEAAQNNLLCNFNGGELTRANIDAYAEMGFEPGTQLTLIGAKAIANGRYEPFATRVLMTAGNTPDNAVNVQLYDDGVIVVGDETIAAVAFIVSKGSQESNDYRSTQKMRFVNGYESLKSLEAMQAAIDSYAEGYEVNSLNSNWYLNQDNDQAFNGRVEKVNVSRREDNHNVFNYAVCGVQVVGDKLTYVVFTDDGDADGKLAIVPSGREIIFNEAWSPASDIIAHSPTFEGVQVTYARITEAIAAQAGFTLAE